MATYNAIDPEGGGGLAQSGSPAIWRFDLSKDGYPSNKRLIGITRTGISDELHIDDVGRIWTGEGQGVTVRSPEGRVLGVFNTEALLAEAGWVREIFQSQQRSLR